MQCTLQQVGYGFRVYGLNVKPTSPIIFDEAEPGSVITLAAAADASALGSLKFSVRMCGVWPRGLRA